MNLTHTFNELLKKSLSIENEVDHNNICLISKEQLKTQFIKLSCGHCFNYEPIFNEIIKQKLHTSYKETQKLDRNCIKCPYCRTVQTKLLPLHPKFKKIKNVNTPLKYCMENPFYSNNCKYVFKSGKNKHNKCNVKCFNEYCTRHEKQLEKKKEKKLPTKKNTTNSIIKNTVKNEIIQIKENFPFIDLLNINTEHPTIVFKTTCDHCFKKGKNKGITCNKEITITYTKKTNTILSENSDSLFLVRKRICKKHCKLKMYKNFSKSHTIKDKYIFDTNIIEPNTIPVKMTDKTLKLFNDPDIPYNKKVDIFETTCEYYLKDGNYIISGFENNNFSQLKLVKKVFKI